MQLSKLFPALLAVCALVGCEMVAQSSAAQGGTSLRRVGPASADFHRAWSDGKAEVAYYELEALHYGEIRKGSVVLIYVTEPMDSRSWIKDDRGQTPADARLNVLKLNNTRKFRTGIYEYSAMTSVFAPVDVYEEHVRFAPKKITFSSQEWCGQDSYRLMSEPGGFQLEVRSYFSSLGTEDRVVKTPDATVYEDGLWIQLRELDGSFAQGQDWSGHLVPSLWGARKSQRFDLLPATITRRAIDVDGQALHRFEIATSGPRRTIDVEREGWKRIVGWQIEGVEKARLVSAERLEYWNLNKLGDESYFERLIGKGPDTVRVASLGAAAVPDSEAAGEQKADPNTEFSHGLLDRALKRLVIGGLVDYAAAKTDSDLAGYLKQIAVQDPQAFKGDDARLAFWINAYNAYTVDSVAELWPKIRSVSDVYPDFGFFKRRQHVIGGTKYSLDQIENQIIRKRFKEPRIHAALNCASMSCPPLLNEAFEPGRLDAQLEKQMRVFVRDESRNRIEPGSDIVRISEIFKWFEKDFRAAGGVRSYLERYVEKSARPQIRKAKIRYLKYDWSLNKTR